MPTMTDIPPTTSASQLVTYAMCGRLYFYRYVLHAEPEFRALNLALGSALHSTIGWWFQEKLNDRQPTLDAVDRVFSADFAAETVQIPIRWNDKQPEEVEAKGQALVRAYLAKHGDLPVASVEQRFEVDIVDPDAGESLPRPLVGYFDLVLKDRNEVVELKSASKAWHPLSLLRHLQVGAYVAAVNALYGGPARITVHAILKQRTPRVEQYPVQRDVKSNGWFFQAARFLEKAIHAGHFPPSPGFACLMPCEFAKRCLSECHSVQRVRPNVDNRHSVRSLPVVVHAA